MVEVESEIDVHSIGNVIGDHLDKLDSIKVGKMEWHPKWNEDKKNGRKKKTLKIIHIRDPKIDMEKPYISVPGERK